MKHLAIALSITVAAGFAMMAAGDALATGTLSDNGVLVQTFGDGSGSTPISADVAYGFIWTASGGSPGGNRLARYLNNGTLDQSFAPGIDFRSLYTNNAGQLFSKEFGAGNVHSITATGVPALLYTLNDPDAQSSASLNGPDTELYTMSAPTLQRYNAANGAPLGSVTLIGMTAAEMAFPDITQMETNGAGRILTYSNGVVSEWNLAGQRTGTCNIPIGSPQNFNTEWSFGVGSDNRVYLYEEVPGVPPAWKSYDIGLGGVTAVEPTTWGHIKSQFSPGN